MKLTRFCAPLFVLSFSANVAASDNMLEEATYNFFNKDSAGNFIGTNGQAIPTSSSQSVITIDGVDIQVGLSVWSDTGAQSAAYRQSDGNYYWNTLDGDSNWEDDTVRSASAIKWGNGFGIENGDRNALTDPNGYTNPHDGKTYHLQGDSHSIDNFNDYGSRDFDMVLLSFDKAVTLTGASFSALYGGGSNKDITVAGLSSDAGFDGHSTWSDIAANTIANAVGHFNITNDNGVIESTFTPLATAKYWLVGAYNTIFDNNASSLSSVGFKLSSLTIGYETETTTPPSTEVSEPGALALMSLGLGLVLYRRKRRV
ncbi:exosortase-dependent surface protein XDP1 [Alteromonas gracilis]|uniref:PEP-CTERM sorting domain-containing protein n=1 Tax=Alteromonas gracilis TaxID=1479524 RepID=A0ABX5CM25_9ALTE|nr:exosortase-dependent surface protein XDP1 [Alteromonas gracilis]PRO68604.1 PEP-CTERM sorting domain-containing protein [Alteromonas gracilis]